ncbi:chemotaxis protein CheX [Virgibacillus necropolis]|uniref:chemotaxis protein CheX n=1 Tax=Virgibacillus necropolis TaxID=163877 RepID=UPI00384C0F95
MIAWLPDNDFQYLLKSIGYSMIPRVVNFFVEFLKREVVVLTISVEERNRSVKELLNGTYTSLKTVVPIKHEIAKPQLLEQLLHIQFGVLIGITGDVKGKLVLAGDTATFGSIGEAMFGMPVEGEMLSSFSGELGNMIAGSLSTNIVKEGINTDITSPTIIEGNTKLSGFERAIKVTVDFDQVGEMEIYLLLD